MRMKIGIVLLAGAAIANSAVADIQDPPSNDYGPTRKLGRGLSNFFIAPAEIPVTIATISTDEGNAAAAGYGVVRGLGRSGARHIAGLLEILLWPVPASRHGWYASTKNFSRRNWRQCSQVHRIGSSRAAPISGAVADVFTSTSNTTISSRSNGGR